MHVAKAISSIFYTTYKTHGLLPAMHFGGCPGRTTTDSLHLLTDTVKATWHRKKVVSILFLDVEGAFPNMVTHHLLHNMWKWRCSLCLLVCNLCPYLGHSPVIYACPYGSMPLADILRLRPP